MAPEALEDPRPILEWPDRLHVGAIKHLASVSPHMDQAHVAEHLEVLRDGGLPHAQRRDDVADRSFAGREINKDVAAARFGDGIEHVRGRGGPRQGSIVFPLRNMASGRNWTFLIASYPETRCAIRRPAFGFRSP